MFDESFFVALGFVVFVAVAGRLGWRHVIKALDDRAAAIRHEIEEAARLRGDAQMLLVSHQRKRRDTEREVAAMIERARAAAAHASAEAEQSASALVALREQQAKDRIAQAEAQAVKEIRAAAITLALGATERLVQARAATDAGDAMIDRAIERLAVRLD